ncbi:DegT/DnrJ/EryC1/StrS family aminotransferase [Streptomyces alanosinicus]|uniref:Aminotransferase n=1 Tax=Streptomyces alanosinicus TaxID=68171 RepID=A0A919D199_9ACTN|nr:DegT/DnrJ/EryC1/StrS aminotransferase family protein [Streptomyces alanosinicus]GHE01652.1 aminotransferase [Streptomyces alanosinicus]
MIPVFKPFLDIPEKQAGVEALDNGWLGMGSYVASFEQALGNLLEVGESKYVAAVSTGHAALHLGLLLAGVGPGDEVITPAFNNVSDFQAILACGARPVFCDIDPDTLCIDLDAAEKLITPRVKAMIVMDYDCLLCDHDRVAEIAARHGIRVVHDAAHSLGSRHRGRMVGSFSDICMFSFDAVKTITTIDGGALVVNSKAELEQIHEMRLVGMTQPSATLYTNQRAWTYDVTRLGFRYHMANLHAAIGLAQLSRFSEISRTRLDACHYYQEHLNGIPEVTLPKTDFKGVVPFLYYIRVPEESRDALRAHMRERGVDSGIHWQPGHWYSLFKDCRSGDLSVTDRVGREVLSIPLHSGMDRATLETVVESVTSFFGKR